MGASSVFGNKGASKSPGLSIGIIFLEWFMKLFCKLRDDKEGDDINSPMKCIFLCYGILIIFFKKSMKNSTFLYVKINILYRQNI